jgi:hypothetical protein
MAPGGGGGGSQVLVYPPSLDFWKSQHLEKKEIYQILIPTIKLIFKIMLLFYYEYLG